MRLARVLSHRFRSLFRRGQAESEIEREFELHIDQLTKELMQEGMSERDARLAARREFGAVEVAKEQCRDARGVRLIEDLVKDLGYGMRLLAKAPGFTLAAVVSLALGIGANTAIFSVVNAVMLRPLPFHAPDRLVRVSETNVKRGWTYFSVSAPNYLDWRKQQSVFEDLAAQETKTFNLTGSGQPVRVAAAGVSRSFFPVLGIQPQLGRNFLPEEELAGRDHVALLSEGLWKGQFGADPRLVGQAIRLNGESYTVVGIMPSRTQPAWLDRDLWVPLLMDPAVYPWRADRSNHMLSVIGRLKPGVGIALAQAGMETIGRRLEQQYADSNTGWSIRLQTFDDWVVSRQLRRAFWVLMAAVAFMLLIACANVANLSLARAAARQAEVAIRSALGAGRERVMRQYLTESWLLASLGCVAGLMLAYWGVRFLAAHVPGDIPRLDEARIDGRVLGFTLALSLLTSLVFGLAPAFHASRVDLSEAFKEGSARLAGGVRQGLRSMLVAGEIALALVLLIGSGLTARSLVRLQQVSPGFDTENLLVLQTALPAAQYPDAISQASFYTQALDRIRALPGVSGASAATHTPISGSAGNWAMEVSVEGRPAPRSAAASADTRAISPGYFQTLGVPVVRGRDFTPRDGPNTLPAAVISDAMARRFWPGEDPVGRRFRTGPGSAWTTVIGVVADIRQISLEQDPRPALYLSAAQLGIPALTIMVRTANNPEGYLPAVRGAIAAVDRELPVYSVRTMSAVVAEAIGQPRLQAGLLGLFAVIALVLAAVGIYGVMSYSVARRTHEVGIRLALGAQASDAVWLVMRRGMLLAAAGIAIGLAAAFPLTALMSSLLYGVSATDPATFGGIALLLALVALLACYLPARRATKVDPIVALRYE